MLRHDLRNRLSSIQNAVFFLEKKLALASAEKDPRVMRFLTLIREQVASADKLIAERANHASLFGTQRAKVPLAPLAERAIAEAARQRPDAASRISLEASSTVVVDVDPREVVLALTCLLDNALDAARTQVRVSVRADDEGARVEVADDGAAGLSDEQFERATVAFHSTKPGHSGLGLNIAARVATRYGGLLELLRAPPDGGARIALRLPRPGAQDV